MVVNNQIRVGSRVYLKTCIAGEPGCVVEIDRHGRANVQWSDIPDMGWTAHNPDSLVVDESFRTTQLGFAFEEAA